MENAVNPPLILTLSIEEEAAQFFNDLRKKHFPPGRNFIDAHLTLFHALPNRPDISENINSICRVQPPFLLLVKQPVSIGKGVAFKIESKELAALHKQFQINWKNDLTPQDAHSIWPHITIQNKVAPQQVQLLLADLKSNFTPFTARATGLQLWEYLNGPWRHVKDFLFEESVSI